jgi:magnesium chelatase family protein
MVVRIHSYILEGIDAIPCEIEVDNDRGEFDKDILVGLPDASVRESLERVKSALANSGYCPARGHSLINLAPADVRKEGPMYDLPIAVGMLLASKSVPPGGLDPATTLFAGELALDGRVRPVRGALAMADLARTMGMDSVVLPAENAPEAAVMAGVAVYGVSSIAEVVGLLSGAIDAEPMPVADVEGMLATAMPEVDFAEVKGQESVKRAMVIAAAGRHNLLILCPSDGYGGDGLARRSGSMMEQAGDHASAYSTSVCAEVQMCHGTRFRKSTIGLHVNSSRGAILLSPSAHEG